MLETKRIKEIKNLYKGEIEELLYEEVTKDYWWKPVKNPTQFVWDFSYIVPYSNSNAPVYNW